MFKVSVKSTTYGTVKRYKIFGFSFAKKIVISGRVDYYFLGIKFLTRFSDERNNPNVVLSQIVKKMSMVDNIWRNKDTLFYVPYYPRDAIQRCIVDREQFYEEDILENIDRFIPDDSVIFDCGANIGNHSLYWAKRRKPKSVYAFEPLPETFSMLTKNIEINKLTNVIHAYNIGLSDAESAAEVTIHCVENIGGTAIEASDEGSLKLMPLDSFVFAEEKLDFMKIDVEGHECLLLNGALETIKKYKPVIFIESSGENLKYVTSFLSTLGYSHVLTLGKDNHLFRIGNAPN